jgi:5-amino-6-(5-phosphoribosylamino)uracil reductase
MVLGIGEHGAAIVGMESAEQHFARLPGQTDSVTSARYAGERMCWDWPVRPQVTVVLAMSADGKIADRDRSPARFGSSADNAHLETQIAQADAVLIGAGTLRAYGTSLSITQPTLLHQRQNRGQPSQPIHVVCSRSGELDPTARFFTQPFPRWLLTTATGAQAWSGTACFDRVLVAATAQGEIFWQQAFAEFTAAAIHRLVVLGGGELVATLLAENWVDELWLTVCPLLLGGTTAPTPVDGWGFPASIAPRLDLLAVIQHQSEVFLHYRVSSRLSLTSSDSLPTH